MLKQMLQLLFVDMQFQSVIKTVAMDYVCGHDQHILFISANFQLSLFKILNVKF